MEDNSSKIFLRKNVFGNGGTTDNVCVNCSHVLKRSKELQRDFCENCGYMYSFNKESLGRLDFYSTDDTRYSDKERLRCKYYLPFNADEKDVEMEFERWKSRLELMPTDFKDCIKLSNIRKVLIPHALVSCHGILKIQGKASTTSKLSWMKRKIDSTTYEHIAEMDFVGIPLCLNHDVQRGLAEAAEPFGMNNLCEFDEGNIPTDVEILEINNHITSQDLHLDVRIQKGMENYSKHSHQRIGDDVSIIINDSKYENIEFDSCYLPYYLAEYEYNGVKYQVLANGRTGNIACDLPSCTEKEEKTNKRRRRLFLFLTNIPYIIIAVLLFFALLAMLLINSWFSLYFSIIFVVEALIVALIATFVVFINRAILIGLVENVKEGTHYPLPCQADSYIDKNSIELIEDRTIDSITNYYRRDPFLNNVFQWISERFFYGSRR